MSMAYAQTQLATKAQIVDAPNPLEPGPPSIPSVPDSVPSPPIFSGPPQQNYIPQSVPSSANAEKSPSSSDLSQDFIERCQRKLAESIGPIARIVCQQTQAQRPDWTRVAFVEALSVRIQDPQAIAAFKRDLL